MDAAISLLLEELDDDSTETVVAAVHINPSIDFYHALSIQQEDHIKIYGYAEKTIPAYSFSDFQSHFRLKKEAFQILLSEIGTKLEEEPHPGGNPSIDPEKQLLMTIWTLSNQECFRSIADRFGVAKGTAHKILVRVCEVINTFLLPKYIKFPTEGELRRKFNDFGIPGMIGATDGCHIPIKKPHKDVECYINRKKFASIILQGVCNTKLEFIDIFVGYPGSVHDARVLRNSPLFHAAETSSLFIDESFSVGDSAYPLRKWLMCPYKDNGHLSGKQKRFNTALSSKRSVIERAFGLLKGRFRRLKHVDMYRTDLIPDIVSSSLTLHNFCLTNTNADEENLQEFIEDGVDDRPNSIQFTVNTEVNEYEFKRTELMNSLVD